MKAGFLTPQAPALLLATALAVATPAASEQPEFDMSRHSIPLELIQSGGPPKDGIPAIDHPHFVAAAEANFLRDADLVVGISGRAGAKAYPLRVLNWHEIVNDYHGQVPIALTYCPLTASAVVFDRRVDGKTLSFGVSGRLYESNLLMYDRQSSSLWSQLAAEAVTGPRTGQSLATRPAQTTRWADWRSAHPSTEVLSIDTGFPRDYHNDPYASYAASTALMFPPSRRDSRMQAKQVVIGVSVGGEHKAYPLAELRMLGTSLKDRIGASDLEITGVSKDGRTALVRSKDPALRAIRAYWFAWASFYPDTAIWSLPRARDAEGEASRRRPSHGESGRDDTNSIVVVEVRSYWSGITGPFVLEPEKDPFSRGGLYVVSGTIKNNSGHTIHHVRLRFDLVDRESRVVYREEGYNRAAEAMIELERPEPPSTADLYDAIVPIPAYGTDSYRMIFIGEEIPRFHHPDVTVVAAE